MTPLVFIILAFAISMVAGLLGALLGLGGGIIVVPALTLLFGIDIRYAIGASIISVIATSSGAAAAYVRERKTNLRVAMFLELGTTLGALTGAVFSGVLQGPWLFVLFGAVMLYSSIVMLKKRGDEDFDIDSTASPDGIARPSPAANHDVDTAACRVGAPKPTSLADRLRLHGTYFDERAGTYLDYRVARAGVGLALMYIAGCVSGLLGIGSGALKVPAMDLAMRMPIKASTATSNFMIGVTAAAGAGVYFVRGDIHPVITAPVAGGVLVGATLGAKLMGRLSNVVLRTAFVAILGLISLQMIYKGITGF